MERIAMSQQERDELDWLRRAKEGSISQREAAQKMGVSDRWVRKLLKRMIKQGDAVVVHGLRGRPSNRKRPAETQRQAVKLLKQPDWHDFGPTFASQQLAKRHGIEVSDETVRKWMIEAGIWQSKSQRLGEVHVWRPRRSAFGELVQWDTSEHDWLEGRGPVRYLVRMIDDATSWSWGRFVERDATPHNMGVLWEYLEKNGRMVDVYTDRDSMFTVPPREGESKDKQREADRLTQLGRALRELGIGSILAYSPQAKGRCVWQVILAHFGSLLWPTLRNDGFRPGHWYADAAPATQCRDARRHRQPGCARHREGVQSGEGDWSTRSRERQTGTVSGEH